MQHFDAEAMEKTVDTPKKKRTRTDCKREAEHARIERDNVDVDSRLN